MEGEPGGEPRRGQRQEVDVNPFWSSRAVDAARLKAMRPEGLPKVPDTVSPRRSRQRWTLGEVPVAFRQ